MAGAVHRAILECGAFAGGGLVIVAVSGGCDSVALLHVLQQLRAHLGITLRIASLNHSLRGDEGRRDLAFVVDLAERWQIPYTAGEADVPQLSRDWGIGIEEAARRARYNFLAQVASGAGAERVAVGHHAGDQAETLLMRLARGTGIRGLRGMRSAGPMPYHPQLHLIRPLLTVSRAQLEAYCRLHSLPFRHDESNDDRSYARNYVRHTLMDLLRQLNPDVTGALGRLAEAAATDEDFIESQFEATVLPYVQVSSDRWRINRERLFALHPALQRRFLQRSFQMLARSPTSLAHTMTLALLQWARKAQTGKLRQLGASIQMRVSYEDLIIECDQVAPDRNGYRLLPGDWDIAIEREAPMHNYGMTIRLTLDAAPTSGISLNLPADLPLRLRTRRPGDRFKPKGMDGRSRKLKDWMIDRKIPREIRERIPLVCADGEIIAICQGELWHVADMRRYDAQAGRKATLFLE